MHDKRNGIRTESTVDVQSSFFASLYNCLCAASIATVQAISTPKVLANAAAQGAKILAGLQKALQNNPNVTQVRGLGLLIGVELASPCREIMLTALKHKIVLNVTRLNVLRITPPLIINDQQAQAMIDIIPKVIEEYYSS